MWNARAVKPKIYGIWGPGDAEIGDMAEWAMTRRDVVEVDNWACVDRDNSRTAGVDERNQCW